MHTRTHTERGHNGPTGLGRAVGALVVATSVACGGPSAVEPPGAAVERLARAGGDGTAGDPNDGEAALAVPALLADDEGLPAELVDHSSLDDLIVVMHAQAEHLRMSGEVVLGRAEGDDPEVATTVSPQLVELAHEAQAAADALTEAVSEVADDLGIFIPAGAVSANHRVVERLALADAERFDDLYIESQRGTLKRARKALKHAFKLNPRHVRAFERAAGRLNAAFEMFDFVQQNAAAAVSDPLGAARFGAGMVDKAGDLLHGGNGAEADDDAAPADPDADPDASSEDAQLGEVRQRTAAAAAAGRRVHFRVHDPSRVDLGLNGS